jgi:hypothetical protein
MGILNWRRSLKVPPSADIALALERLVPLVPSPTDPELGEIWLREGPGVSVRARHIVILLVPPKATPLFRDAARRQAEIAHARAVAGEDFVALVREFTNEPWSREHGGDLSYFGRGRMVPEFEKVAFALNPGEISGVVETPFGYHIIRVEDRRHVKMPNLAAFRAFYRERAQRNAEREYIEQLKAQARVEVQAGAAEWVRELAKRPIGGISRWTGNRKLVLYRGGRLTVGDMAQVLRSEPDVRNLAEIANASDAALNGFLTDQAARTLVWAAAQRAGSSSGTRSRRWSVRGSAKVVPAAPGAGLLWFADFFYSRKDSEEALKPVVLDMRVEYNEALSAGRVAKAIWIQVRGTLAFVYAASRMTPLGKAIAYVLGMLEG